MTFRLIPVLEQMEKLYQLPRGQKRFERYLTMLQGSEGDNMILPIAGYNPMGGENILDKLGELRNLDAEAIAREEADKITREVKNQDALKISVAINLADDIGGAWTQRYSTDFSSKFNLEALLKRNFCTPYFWTSENYSPDLISLRCREYMYRTLYRSEKGKPHTLQDHAEQEIYVMAKSNTPIPAGIKNLDLSETELFYQNNSGSTDYPLIFNFFYGDEASLTLGYKCSPKSLQPLSFLASQLPLS